MSMDQRTLAQSPLDYKVGASFGSHDEADDNNLLHGFECNICLDAVQEPVVTFCGHLYCWPCIYKWIQNPNHQKSSPCPVCKKEVSLTTVIPLYGAAAAGEDKMQNRIPERPRRFDCRCSALSPSPVLRSPAPAPASWAENASSNYMVDPMIGMLGDIICGEMFGESGTGTTSFYGHRVAYGNGNWNRRRFMRRSEESLGRILLFLFCCVVLCLLLF
ncbi:E3 ubiquitin-protein ligase RMA1H1-like [Andrographis paniculata]|uniref:E3 ubiquitin-protein ligase RMA1H1-like n=1 Tax=Andrographis paniculata TaxID=175694 RepID=UPI0021E8E9AA|nr:E3 ubiquitin-protein ligase RMA1H1-like [Andrographis paniculata]XP_051136413.1 E3 ubiquitin-protein ligase RMA1H1-like [Andrographis paniculata]